MTELEVFFDYLCPYCYLGLHDLNDVLAAYPVLPVRWCPCEAHPRPEPRFVWGDASEWKGELFSRINQRGMPIHSPYTPSNYSDKAIQGMLILQDQGGNVSRYNDAVYAAVFADGRNIEDPDVLCACAEACGFDAARFREILLGGTYHAKQAALNRYAWEENALEAIPSFRFGDFRLNAIPAVGVQKADLAAFLEKHASE